METQFNIEKKLNDLINEAQLWQMNEANTHASKVAETRTESIEKQIISYVRQLEAKAS